MTVGYRSPLFARCATAVALAMVLGTAHAGSDHDRARAAVEAGQVLPLRTLLGQLEREHPGQVLEVELEQSQGRWVYEIKLLQPGGRLARLELDARTGEVLRERARERRNH